MNPEPYFLGKLADPAFFTEPLSIEGMSAETLRNLLVKMIEIRKSEEIIGDLVTKGQVKCPCHLAIGQEAIAVAVSESLRPTDRVFGGHRAHAQYLALGGSPFRLFSEVLGRATGCSNGMGGSMHLYAEDKGLKGTVPLVAATIPLAAGAALAAKLEGSGDIAVSFFGDGATEEGVFHETMNLAAVQHLPTLFICENNLFSSHLHIDIRQPMNSIARYAVMHGIESKLVDGNDIIQVADVIKEAVRNMRLTPRPFLLEAVTYRWRGHVGPREDLDVGVQRNNDLPKWKERDPIKRLYLAMEKKQIIDSKSYQKLEADIQTSLKEDLRAALNAPYPEPEDLLDFVYQNSNPSSCE